MCKYDSRSSTLGYVDKADRLGVDILGDTEVEKVLIDVEKGRGVARGLQEAGAIE